MKEIKASDYFVMQDRDDLEAWPTVLREASEKELVISAFGALLQYLRTVSLKKKHVSLLLTVIVENRARYRYAGKLCLV